MDSDQEDRGFKGGHKSSIGFQGIEARGKHGWDVGLLQHVQQVGLVPQADGKRPTKVILRSEDLLFDGDDKKKWIPYPSE